MYLHIYVSIGVTITTRLPLSANAKLYFMFQIGNSVYELGRLHNSTWRGAESYCVERGGHLWSINSHMEWAQILNSLSIHRYFKNLRLIDSFRLVTSTIFFIGLYHRENVFTNKQTPQNYITNTNKSLNKYIVKYILYI